MKRITNVLFFYIKRLLAIKTYVISYVILFLFLLTTLLSEGPGLLASGISDMAVPMQIHVFFMMLSGFFIVKGEARYGVLSIYNNRPKDSLLVISCIIAGHLLISFTAYLFYFLLYFIDFSTMNIVTINFTVSFSYYLFLFWFIVPLLFFSIGVVVATFFHHKKFSFLLLLILWLGLGPFNSYLFPDLVLNITQSTNANTLFYIYPEISTRHYGFLHGFYFDGAVEFRILFWLVIFILLLLSYFAVIFKDKLQRITIYGSMVVLILLNIFVFNQFIITENSSASEHDDIEIPITELQTDYVIEQMDIQINHGNSIKVSVLTKLKMNEQMAAIDLYLDDDFIILDILDQDNHSFSFKRTGKLVTINLENKINTSIEFIYKYVGENPSKKNGFVFDNDQAWVPVKPIVPATIASIGLGFPIINPLYNDESIAYSLQVNSPMDVYSSLTQELNHKSSGESNHGIFVVVGKLEETSYESIPIIKPTVLTRLPADFEKDMQKMKNVHKFLKEDMGFDAIGTDINQVVVVGLSPGTSLFQGVFRYSLTPSDYGEDAYQLFNNDNDIEHYLLKRLFPTGAMDSFAHDIQLLFVKLVTMDFKNSPTTGDSIGSEESPGFSSSIVRFIDSLIEMDVVVDGEERHLVFVEDEKAREIVQSIIPTYKGLQEKQKVKFIQDLYDNFSGYAVDWRTFNEQFLVRYQGDMQ